MNINNVNVSFSNREQSYRTTNTGGSTYSYYSQVHRFDNASALQNRIGDLTSELLGLSPENVMSEIMVSLPTIQQHVDEILSEVMGSSFLNTGYEEEETPKSVLKDEDFDKFTKGYSTKDCSICLDMIGDSIMLPCGHTYHEKCAKMWLMEQSSTCPLCKFNCKPAS